MWLTSRTGDADVRDETASAPTLTSVIEKLGGRPVRFAHEGEPVMTCTPISANPEPLETTAVPAHRRRLMLRAIGLSVFSILVSVLLLQANAQALTVARAELKGSQLRVQGANAAPGIVVTASSTTSSAGARADQKGQFTIQASGFTAPDCKVVVTDRRTLTVTVSITNCTPSAAPVPATPAAPGGPTGTCVITPQSAPVNLTAGTNSVVYFTTTGCNTTFNTGATPSPLQWSVVAGSIPTGMSGPNFQGTDAANIIGTPAVAGTYTFTLKAVDSAGNTDQENFIITVI
jgi:hypothetical protein